MDTQHDSMHPYHSLQLVLFSGKGGVGKTTISSAFARSWGHQFPNERILLLSTDPAHSLGDVLLTPVGDRAQPQPDLPNLSIRALDAQELLKTFKQRYGEVLQLLVERGSFATAEDLAPVWELNWPGLDELMGILEIQRLLREKEVDRVVVDMAPSGHALNLLGLMDFLDNFLAALDLFQEKHRAMSQAFTGRHQADEADRFLQEMQADLSAGRQLLQDATRTHCLVVSVAEPMSCLETERFLASLQDLQIHAGGLFINRIVKNDPSTATLDRYSEQQRLLSKLKAIAQSQPVFLVPQLSQEPLGAIALDLLFAQVLPLEADIPLPTQPTTIIWPEKIPPGLSDFIAEGRQLIVVGGKGGVGKSTVAAAIAWGLAQRHAESHIRVISIDPAHSLGDAFGLDLDHEPYPILDNLIGAEIDSETLLVKFREDYLWELAEMISGDSGDPNNTLQLLYGPEAWRKIVAQSLPGIDEILSLLAVIDLLEQGTEDLVILDTAPTGHLLRFLEMPTALSDWLAWIFKLWIKYQDVLGRTEFMGRLRSLRQRVVKAEKKLKDPKYTEFIGVFQKGAAVIAEQVRLTESLAEMGVYQRYLVQNRFEVGDELLSDRFGDRTLVHLPNLPRSVEPIERIKGAAGLLFD